MSELETVRLQQILDRWHRLAATDTARRHELSAQSEEGYWSDARWLLGQLHPGAVVEYVGLACLLARYFAQPTARTLALSGGQGTGKTTLSGYIARVWPHVTERTLAVLALDDFYLTKAARQRLARDVHPLLATRGVPGTHDVGLAQQVQHQLLTGTGDVAVPVFDKGLDDRMPRAQWRQLQAPVDAVLWEGWCLAIPPQPSAELAEPANALERDEDPRGQWRTRVNTELGGAYGAWFASFERTVALLPPDFAAVHRWRAQQELQLPAERRQSAAQLERFIAHYERLTQLGLRRLKQRADIWIELNASHEVAALGCGAA